MLTPLSVPQRAAAPQGNTHLVKSEQVMEQCVQSSQSSPCPLRQEVERQPQRAEAFSQTTHHLSTDLYNVSDVPAPTLTLPLQAAVCTTEAPPPQSVLTSARVLTSGVAPAEGSVGRPQILCVCVCVTG